MKQAKDMGIISISGHEYQYRTVPDLRKDDGTGLDGWYRVNDREILIEADLPKARAKTVLIHEIVHGILEHAGMGGMEPSAQERISDAIAYGLMSVRINGRALIK
jgi:hypothetical protein